MFYHVRFFKVPKIQQSFLKAVVTIANDLGDAYFYGDAVLTAKVISGSQILQTSEFTWTPGMQACPIELSTQIRAGTEFQILVHAEGTDLLHENEKCGFLKVCSSPYISQKDGSAILNSDSISHYSALALREIPYTVHGTSTAVHLYEEVGTHNLARHLWDAGICLSLLFSGSSSSPKCDNSQFIKTFPYKRISHVVELGSGCGIMGLSLEKLLPTSIPVYLTDTQDASDQCRLNMRLNRSRCKYEEYTWGTAFTAFNVALSPGKVLLVATDCTYNPSSYKSLMATFEQFSSRALLLLAHKYRGQDEEAFFEDLDAKYNVAVDFVQNFYGERVRIVLVEL